METIRGIKRSKGLMCAVSRFFQYSMSYGFGAVILQKTKSHDIRDCDNLTPAAIIWAQADGEELASLDNIAAILRTLHQATISGNLVQVLM